MGHSRAHRIAIVALAVAATSSCTGSRDSENSTSPTAPISIEFAIAAKPLSQIGVDATYDEGVGATSEAVVVGDVLLTQQQLTGDLHAYDVHTGNELWQIDEYGGAVGPGKARAIPFVTSVALGGLVFVPYAEECFWDGAPCTGAPAGTWTIEGVAAVSIADGSIAWRSELFYGGIPGPTEDDDIYLEPSVTAADATAVVVTLSTHDGRALPSGTPAVQTFLLDASTGAQSWRTSAFEGRVLTNTGVYGVLADQLPDVGPTQLGAVTDRASGAVSRDELNGDIWYVGGFGPGVVVQDRREVGMESTPIEVRDDAGDQVSSGADDQRLAEATCSRSMVEPTVACEVQGGGDPGVLLTWSTGEAKPTSADLPELGARQLFAHTSRAFLLNQNGYVSNTDPAYWLAVNRSGEVVSATYPGTVIAASDDYVVVANKRDGAYGWSLSTFEITTPG